tara:strand:+ start:8581 stop:8733 length:153 start_codon:yes stop_codon:yes gene_type:complete
MKQSKSLNSQHCILPRTDKALEVIYSLIWKKEKKDRELLILKKQGKRLFS